MFHHLFAVGQVNHLNFSAYQVDVGGNQIEVGRFRLGDDGFRVNIVDDALVNAGFHAFRVDAHARSRVGLRVGVDE